MLKPGLNKSMRIMMLFLFSIVMTNSYALQTKHVSPNQTVVAYIAQNNKTRLFVSGDRITALRGTPSAYTFVNDNINGQVFITPTPLFQNKRFSLFVTTELGNTYGLILIPQKALSDTIMLVPKNLNASTSFDSGEQIIHLLRAMISNKSVQGFAEVNSKQTKPILKNQMSIQLLESRQGKYWQANRYRITNLSNYPLKLVDAGFYQAGIRAIVLASNQLPAKGNTTLYTVTKIGATS